MSITEILGWIIFGLIVGALARLLVPGRQNIGWIATILLGIVGSFLGGVISSLLFGNENGSIIQYSGYIGSILGAIVVLLIYIKLVNKS